jgi:hypothetical protein
MAIKDIEARLAAQYPGLEPTFNPEQPFVRIVMEWVTAMDDRVCDSICLPLDGQQWEQDDPTIPTPPDDTHVNCRCRLQLTEIASDQELNASEASELIALASLVVFV